MIHTKIQTKKQNLLNTFSGIEHLLTQLPKLLSLLIRTCKLMVKVCEHLMPLHLNQQGTFCPIGNSVNLMYTWFWLSAAISNGIHRVLLVFQASSFKPCTFVQWQTAMNKGSIQTRESLQGAWVWFIFLSRQITMEQIWIMMLKLHWNIERFMNSLDGLNGLQIQGRCPVKYKEDECLTTSRLSVTLLIIFHIKSNRKKTSCKVGIIIIFLVCAACS